MELLPFFEWLETSLLGQAAKSYGGLYAMFQSAHLLAMALLGGCVLITDLRIMNIAMTDTPARAVVDGAHKWFKVGLIIILATGVFMLAGVATKCYHNAAYWAKMAALFSGILFVFLVKQPLLKYDLEQIKPWVLKSVGISSLLIWFTVAAAGRWIGFS
ncbi:hypothetical protein NBRC116494_05100 [Aurantivibrio plasticivorans]